MTPFFVPLANGAQVQIVFQFAGEALQNRLWFVSRQPPVDATQIGALAVGVEEWHRLQVMPLLSSSLTLVQVEAHDWTSFPPPSAAIQVSGTSGSASADSHSANVAVRVWFYSSFNQGRIRNSNFVAGIPKDAVALNTVNPTFRDAVFDAYVNLIDLAFHFGPTPAWRWVCASAEHLGALRSAQLARQVDFIRFKRPFVAQRRSRLPPP
jgi:hypothetical protein